MTKDQAQSIWQQMLDQDFFTLSPEQIPSLFSAGADVNKKSNSGKTALMMTAEAAKNYSEVMRMLLRAGAEVDIQDYYRNSSLLYAYAGHDPIAKIRILLAAGAEANLQHKKLLTLLMCCGINNSVEEMVQVLLEGGADRTMVDSKGRTAAFIAKKKVMTMLFGY